MGDGRGRNEGPGRVWGPCRTGQSETGDRAGGALKEAAAGGGRAAYPGAARLPPEGDGRNHRSGGAGGHA